MLYFFKSYDMISSECLGVIFIRIKIKGYLKNITENEIINFETKGIKNKNKITYSNDDVKNVIKTNGNEIILIREGNEFVNTFVFNKKNSSCNYLIKDNNYDVNIDVNTIMMNTSDNSICIKYVIVDSNCEYEYKIEMSDV